MRAPGRYSRLKKLQEDNTRLRARVEVLEGALQYLVNECDEEMDADYNPHSAPLAKARAALADNGESG